MLLQHLISGSARNAFSAAAWQCSLCPGWLSADMHPLIALQERAQEKRFLCLKRRKKDTPSFPTQKYVLHHLKAQQFKINLGFHPFSRLFCRAEQKQSACPASFIKRCATITFWRKLGFRKNRTSCFTSLKSSSQLIPAKTVVQFSALSIVSRISLVFVYVSVSSVYTFLIIKQYIFLLLSTQTS